jgi:GTP cyclohydrolase I
MMFISDLNHGRIQAAIDLLLKSIGEDPTREGLVDTPARVASFWKEFIDYDPGNIDVTFESVQVDQMVAVTGIRVWSLCEHHLLPFWCDLSIGYLTTGSVIGLSKMARIAHKHAHKLQIQERMVDQIAKELQELVSDDVAVIGKGFHMCMAMRGIKTPATMVTSAMRGRFLTKPEVRAEFMELIK